MFILCKMNQVRPCFHKLCQRRVLRRFTNTVTYKVVILDGTSLEKKTKYTKEFYVDLLLLTLTTSMQAFTICFIYYIEKSTSSLYTIAISVEYHDLCDHAPILQTVIKHIRLDLDSKNSQKRYTINIFLLYFASLLSGYLPTLSLQSPKNTSH